MSDKKNKKVEKEYLLEELQIDKAKLEEETGKSRAPCRARCRDAFQIGI